MLQTILLIIFSVCFLGGCKKPKDRPPVPEVGPIKLCTVDAPADKSRTDCLCGMTTGKPFNNIHEITPQKIYDVIMAAPIIERLPIQDCDKGVLIPSNYWFIFKTWLDDLMDWISSYCTNLVEVFTSEK